MIRRDAENKVEKQPQLKRNKTKTDSQDVNENSSLEPKKKRYSTQQISIQQKNLLIRKTDMKSEKEFHIRWNLLQDDI